jgi:hypothetical protein
MTGAKTGFESWDLRTERLKIKKLSVNQMNQR